MSNTNPNEGSKAKLYWTIGIVAAVLAAALLGWNVWNSNDRFMDETAAVVGEQEFTMAEVSYYYQAVANTTIQEAQQYAAFGVDMGYDASLPASEQFYNEEEGVTYADYFLETALSQLQQVTVLCAEAEDAGYTLSEDGQAAFEENKGYLTAYSVQNYTNEESYLKMVYGSSMTMELFEKVLADSLLAEEFAQVKAEEFTYSDSELNAYYADNTDALDSYDYRYCYINYEVEEETDEEGNVIEATDEEIAAAMDEAKAKADAMIAQVRGGTAFNTAAAEQLDETSAASYSADPEYNHKTDVLGNSLSTSITTDAVTWLMDGTRAAGDITAIEMANTGYCVVQFLGRDKGIDSYQTMDYRTIVVMAETDRNEDGTEALPTDEQITAAKDEAEALLAQWQEGEDLEDQGELVEGANRDALAPALTDWLFADGRKVGDAAVVEYSNDSGNVVGYQVVFAEGFGDIRWQYHAANALRAEDYNAWYSEVEANYPAELTEVAQKIPAL